MNAIVTTFSFLFSRVSMFRVLGLGFGDRDRVVQGFLSWCERTGNAGQLRELFLTGYS